MPSGPMLGTHQPHRTPHTTGLSLDSAFGWKRTAPTDAGLDDGADHVGVHKRIRLWWDAQPNESRLSCGATLKYRSEEHTSELQSHHDHACRLRLEHKKAKAVQTRIPIIPARRKATAKQG